LEGDKRPKTHAPQRGSKLSACAHARQKQKNQHPKKKTKKTQGKTNLTFGSGDNADPHGAGTSKGKEKKLFQVAWGGGTRGRKKPWDNQKRSSGGVKVE